jgi:hypothetical protein
MKLSYYLYVIAHSALKLGGGIRVFYLKISLAVCIKADGVLLASNKENFSDISVDKRNTP